MQYFIRNKKIKKISLNLILICILLLTSANYVYCICTRENIEIIKVYDGDTVLVKNKYGVLERVRLKGIDCYETSKINRAYKQAYLSKITIEDVVKKGKESKIILKNYVKNNKNDYYLKRLEVDRYDRTVGIIYCGEININSYMLEHGKCLKYEYKGK